MPAYIKVYCAFAILLLLWAAGISIALTYLIIFNHAAEDDGLLYSAFAYLLLSLAFFKALLSIKAWQRYKQNQQLTKAQKIMFIAAYSYILLFTAGLLLMLVFIIPEDFGRTGYYGYGPNYRVVITDGSMLLAAICAVYFSITDLILLKAIRKRHNESLMSFEVGEDRLKSNLK